jgi:hypothetical protein
MSPRQPTEAERIEAELEAEDVEDGGFVLPYVNSPTNTKSWYRS